MRPTIIPTGPARVRWRDGIVTALLTLLAMLALPVLVILIFFARAALLAVAIAALVGGLLAVALSPRFREWLQVVGETLIAYKGLHLATDVGLGPGHVWVRLSGAEASVGHDDLAQAALGPVDRVDLPAPGEHVELGQPLFRLHRGQRSLTAPSPLTGTVMAVNETLLDQPSWVNSAPYEQGWAVRVGADDVARQRHGLRRGARARELFRRDVDRLLGAVAAAEGMPTLADGGELVAGIFGHIDDECWRRLQTDVFAAAAACAERRSAVDA